MSRKKYAVLAVALLAAASGVAAFMMNRGKPEGIAVQTARVGRQEIVQTVTATGKIQPETRVKISADVSAKITRLPVKEGAWVEKGDFLLELDRERYVAAVERAEANLRASQANVKLCNENRLKAEKDHQRTRELFEKNLEPQSSLDAVYATYQVMAARHESARDEVEQARATLKQARDDLSKTRIYAPMSGTISALNKEVGEIALGSQFQEDVILVISNLAGMEALVDVDENDIVGVEIGQRARIEIDALPGQLFEGQVTEIASSAKTTGEGSAEQKTEFEVKVGIADPGRDLRPGMTATGDIVTATRDSALGVPIQSVALRTPEELEGESKNGGQPAAGDVGAATESGDAPRYTPDRDGFVEVVFVVENGITRARQVETGIQSDDHIEIVGGLTEGDEVVIGSYRAISKDLKNGSAVVVGTGGEES